MSKIDSVVIWPDDLNYEPAFTESPSTMAMSPGRHLGPVIALPLDRVAAVRPARPARWLAPTILRSCNLLYRMVLRNVVHGLDTDGAVGAAPWTNRLKLPIKYRSRFAFPAR